jgi:hypothetical protein
MQATACSGIESDHVAASDRHGKNRIRLVVRQSVPIGGIKSYCFLQA